jgi:hypothetical protein
MSHLQVQNFLAQQHPLNDPPHPDDDQATLLGTLNFADGFPFICFVCCRAADR